MFTRTGMNSDVLPKPPGKPLVNIADDLGITSVFDPPSPRLPSISTGKWCSTR